jgi:hypothetical protein
MVQLLWQEDPGPFAHFIADCFDYYESVDDPS